MYFNSGLIYFIPKLLRPDETAYIIRYFSYKLFYLSFSFFDRMLITFFAGFYLFSLG